MAKSPLTPSSKFNLVADAREAGLSPSALAHKSYLAYIAAREAMPKKPAAEAVAHLALLHEMQRVYRGEYRAYRRAKHDQIGAKRAKKKAVTVELTAAEVKGVAALNVGLAKVAKDIAAEPNNGLKRASKQRVERADLPQADPERFAVEAPVPMPTSPLGDVQVLAQVLQALTLLKALPPGVADAVLQVSRKR